MFLCRLIASQRIKRFAAATRVIAASNALHTCASVHAKLFLDKENKFAHDVLEQSLKPYKLFRLQTELSDADATVSSLPPIDCTATNIADIFAQFCAVTNYCKVSQTCISDERFTPLVQLFCNECHALSDEQLLQTMRQLAHLPVVESVKVPNYLELWNAIDAECCCRIDDWSTDQLLLVSDAWFTLNLARICDFLPEALRKMTRKILRLKPEQLVQCMFLCNLLRRNVNDMFDFEVNLMRCVSEMSLDELGVMSMGFFKTQSPIRNPQLVAHLYKCLILNIDTVEDITLVAILKVLRYSSNLSHFDSMSELLQSLCSQVDRISLLSCLHAALLGSGIQNCNDELMERILQRFSSEINEIRLKDLERICLAINVFNYKSGLQTERKLCAAIFQSLYTRIDEIIRYPRCFSNCVHFLSLQGYYDVEMISSVLDKKFLQHTFNKNTILGREIFALDSFAKINLRHDNYVGNQLTEKQRNLMGKMFTHYIPDRKYKLNATDTILMDIKETTDKICRLNVFKHVLPHYDRADIVFAYDKQTRQPVPLTECAEDYKGTILTREELLGENQHSTQIQTMVIAVAGWNNVVRGKDRYTSSFDMKLQQLKLLEHNYIVIPWHEWRALENRLDKLNFLKRKLSSFIKI